MPQIFNDPLIYLIGTDYLLFCCHFNCNYSCAYIDSQQGLFSCKKDKNGTTVENFN